MLFVRFPLECFYLPRVLLSRSVTVVAAEEFRVDGINDELGQERRKLAGRFVRVLLLLVSLLTSPATGAEYRVAPRGEDSNAGTNESPWSLAKANASVQPGDTVVLADGNYSVGIAPARSGEEGKPIVYRAANPLNAALFAKMQAAVDLSERSHVVIDGIAARDVHRFIAAVGAHHITVNACRFEDSPGWENCRFRDVGDGIRITNNYFHNGTDLVSISGGNGHLIEGNFFGDASHSGLVLMGVQRSVVRNNRLANRLWKCMEVFSTRKEPERLSLHDVVEGNVFDASPSSCIQFAGNRIILRRNVFMRCRTGMNWAHYVGRAKTPEAWHDRDNRFYNNVIYDCGSGERNTAAIEERRKAGVQPAEAVSAEGEGMSFASNIPAFRNYGGQVIANNIIFRNHHARGRECRETVQVVFTWDAGPAQGGRFLNNDILCREPGQAVFFWQDAKRARPPVQQNLTLQEFEEKFPGLASRNIEVDPRFTAPDAGDFRLKPGSPCIDAGCPLTKARAAGQGTEIDVEDATFFCDGYGIVEPDVLRVGAERVKCVRIDHEINRISLDRRISWETGAPVTLDYRGKAPDLGAFEFDDGM